MCSTAPGNSLCGHQVRVQMPSAGTLASVAVLLLPDTNAMPCYSGPAEMRLAQEFPTHYDVKLAMTCWAKGAFLVLHSLPPGSPAAKPPAACAASAPAASGSARPASAASSSLLGGPPGAGGGLGKFGGPPLADEHSEAGLTCPLGAGGGFCGGDAAAADGQPHPGAVRTAPPQQQQQGAGPSWPHMLEPAPLQQQAVHHQHVGAAPVPAAVALHHAQQPARAHWQELHQGPNHAQLLALQQQQVEHQQMLALQQQQVEHQQMLALQQQQVEHQQMLALQQHHQQALALQQQRALAGHEQQQQLAAAHFHQQQQWLPPGGQQQGGADDMAIDEPLPSFSAPAASSAAPPPVRPPTLQHVAGQSPRPAASLPISTPFTQGSAAATNSPGAVPAAAAATSSAAFLGNHHSRAGSTQAPRFTTADQAAAASTASPSASVCSVATPLQQPPRSSRE